MLNDLAGKSCNFIVLYNKCLNIIILTISGPYDQNIPIPVTNPSFGSIELVLSSVYFIDSCFKVRCIGAYLVLS